MWSASNRKRYDRSRLRYPSDLTDEEWAYVAPAIPRQPGGAATGATSSRTHGNRPRDTRRTRHHQCDNKKRLMAPVRGSGLARDQIRPPSAPGTSRVALRLALPVFVEPAARIIGTEKLIRGISR
jgi:hypothetical protein